MPSDNPAPADLLSLPALQQELHQIIQHKKLNAVFQPIIALDNSRILGYEALIRGPNGSQLQQPDALFACAREAKLLALLDFACRERAYQQFAALKLPGKLFLNMSPTSFTDAQYRDGVTREILQRVGLSAERVVFELTESQPLDETELLRAASEHFRRQGFAVALDDLGAGYSGLRVWSELNPEYVKIDRHFIQGIDRDPVKREFVRAMLDIAQRMGNKVIAEGIECSEELAALVALGVEYVQGFFIARPTAIPPLEVPAHIRELCQLHHSRHQDTFVQRAGDIAVDAQTLAPGVIAAEVVKIFRADVRLRGIPVVDGTRALGMVCRDELLNTFAHRFAHELYANKPVKDFISPLSTMVDVATELKVLGQTIAEDPQQNLSLDFIVTKQGAYLGVGKVRSLLRAISEEKLRMARHSNPLTQLPGNVPLYECIDQRLCSQQAFVAAYCDINQFKPFNDYFGYGMGDQVILCLSQVLLRNINAECDFIGHVGGDDFVVVFGSGDWRNRCEQILRDFSLACENLLPEQAYWGSDRQGEHKLFGPISLAIGCVLPDMQQCKTHHHISLLLADAKHRAKAQAGNQLFVLQDTALH